MSLLGKLRGSVAPAATLVLIFGAGAAQAQLAAETVWQAWQGWYATGGATVTDDGSSRDGATLTLNNVTVTTQADDETSVAMAIGDIAFTEEGDGTVSVQLPDSYALVLTGDRDQRAVAEIRHPGMRISVSETATGLMHNQTTPELVIELTEISGTDAPDDLELSITAQSVTSSWDIPNEPSGPTSTDFAAAALRAVISGHDGSEGVDLDYAATGLQLRFAGTALDQFMAVMEGADIGDALAAGMAIEFGFAYDTLRYRLEVDDFGDEMGFAGTGMDGDSRFVLNAQELSLHTSSRNGEITVRGEDLPGPELTLRAAQLAYGLALPVSGSDAPQAVSLLLRLVDGVLPEDLWMMADPSGQLPRGPVTAVIDMAGQLLLPADLFSMETMFGYMMGGPLEAAMPVSLELRELTIKGVGAELSGSGSFTFDADDLDTFDGVPRPTGALNLALKGGNALLDTLVAIGLVPEDDAMGARMVLALFARPGEGPDELVSTIEMRDDGAVFANGMRLQ